VNGVYRDEVGPRSVQCIVVRVWVVCSIGRNVLSKSVFPDRVVKADGFVLHRPPEWR
jgi:hypothetical protein